MGCMQQPRQQKFTFRVLGWNVGGAELPELPKAIRESMGRRGAKHDLVLLQELPREGEGWQHQELEGMPVVSHRSSRQWRGTGIWYDPSAWCILRRVQTNKGTWFKLRHLEVPLEQWVGTAHFTPGCTVQQYESEIREHFDSLPRQADRVVFQGDVNAGFSWVRDGDQITAVAKEGKGNFLHQSITERELHMGTPSTDQLATPTSRPRQENRQGQCIDVLCYRGLRLREWRIQEGSYMKLGTDHELCSAEFVLEVKQKYPRHETGPRHWVGGISQIDQLDQARVEELARQCTKQVPGRGYKDTQAVKQAFKQARLAGTAQAWKQALKLRKEARKQWEQDRLVRASQGDWGLFRALKPKKQEGWDVGFAEAQTGDPHQAVHEHLASVYQGQDVEGKDEVWSGDVRAFTVEELRKGVSQLSRGKSVGVDKTSTELILGMMEVPGGEQHLLEWYNRILATQEIPQQWNRPLLVLLPKIKAPKKAKELRPIAMGSSVSKLFSRLLLNRSLSVLSPSTSRQCSGPGRQTSDYLYSVIRLFDLCREWGVPLAVFKLDMEKAFDKLDRNMFLQRLEERLGPGAELNCWKGLLRGTVGVLQTPWGCTNLPMNRGIKQGAIESPTFFAWIAEHVLEHTSQKYSWQAAEHIFDDFSTEEMMYMDDGMLWNHRLQNIQARVEQLAVEMATFGLHLNLKKCQLYASPLVVGPQEIRVHGERVQAVESLEVMGLTLRVGMSVYELASPLASRARAKFWELKHIFRAKGGSMKQKAQVMQRVVGGTALWCVCCIPPDAATMSMLNSVQLQLMVWLLRFSKKASEALLGLRGAQSSMYTSASTTYLQ
ncbi:putative 149 kDa protein [Symbiodinium microadriaticum]|uniref:Putative 149 kDa protein n=1 Tax=Symbiodinium microadriaticum TaxID=2951 RepID=A0A1Q9D2Q0_SYMMI|nr:putative 149 kDa protein [Symbiodinium microadriaticum]